VESRSQFVATYRACFVSYGASVNVCNVCPSAYVGNGFVGPTGSATVSNGSVSPGANVSNGLARGARSTGNTRPVAHWQPVGQQIKQAT
jgi:hypothetical protein